MASSDARKELDCSICLNIYTDPVTLKCGHNFCRDCIGRVSSMQEWSGGYSCPECREKFQGRPELQTNITLCNIVENFRSNEPEQKESQIFCTYCIHSPVPAVKSCLMCEASLCDNHLKVHSKSSQHVVSDLNPSLDKRKCSVHKKILEYYCTDDSACLCGSCRLHGEHEYHHVETLEEASKTRKKDLTHSMQDLVEKREEVEQRIESLNTFKGKVQANAAGVTKRVTTMFGDIRRQVDTLERKVLEQISRLAERDFFPTFYLMQELEIAKEELCRKIRHIEEICNMTDPWTVLQESDKGGCDMDDGYNKDKEFNKYKERLDRLLRGKGELDITELSHTLFVGLSCIITRANGGIYVSEHADISLDEDTAHNHLHISDDKKTARRLDQSLDRPTTPMRFQGVTSNLKPIAQVLSSQSFSSGRHYWDVDVGGSPNWKVGVCYPSMNRTNSRSEIGNNHKSWCLQWTSYQLIATHGYTSVTASGNFSTARVRIYLDYEAGEISFYELGIPIRHLHTFTSTDAFTKPLHAALYVGEGCIKICTRNQEAM